MRDITPPIHVPLNYVDEAFRQWAQHEGASYADIAARALEAGDATQG